MDGWGLRGSRKRVASRRHRRRVPVLPRLPLRGQGRRARTTPRSRTAPRTPPSSRLTSWRWLVRLVTPPGGTVLDLFAGSGTTAEACIVEGFRCILIEQDPKSAELIKTRLRQADPARHVRFGVRVSEPAYTPMGPPVRCMTPGHQDREARLYPGGRLCKDCLPRKTGNDEEDR